MDAIDDLFDEFDSASDELKKGAEELRQSLIDDFIGMVAAGITIYSISYSLNSHKKRQRALFYKAEKEFERQSKKIIAMGLANHLNAVEISRILARKQIVLDEFLVVGARMRRDIKSRAISILVNNISKSRAISELKHAYPGYSIHMKSALNAGLQQILRDVVFEDSVKAGFKMFRYSGPRDEKNRPHCALWVGREMDEKTARIQRQIMAQFYNCRHTLIGVKKDDSPKS